MSAIYKSNLLNKDFYFYVEDETSISEDSVARNSQCISKRGIYILLYHDRVKVEFNNDNDELKIYIDDVPICYGGLVNLTYLQAVQIFNYIETNGVNAFMSSYKESISEYIKRLEFTIKSFDTMAPLPVYSKSEFKDNILELSYTSKLLHKLFLY